MSIILKPPAKLVIATNIPSVFLAGSIDMGSAQDWQSRFEREFHSSNITILNPRRVEWDSSWIQSIDNPQFREQVEWELEAQEKADIIAMYFAPESKAPVTLLELGLFARSGKLIVCCPDGYWRKGNVDIVCRRYSVRTTDSLEGLFKSINDRLR